jgi:hypothetical protein
LKPGQTTSSVKSREDSGPSGWAHHQKGED